MLKNPSGMLRYVKAELDGANARRNDAIAKGIEAMATTFLRPNLKIFIYEFQRFFKIQISYLSPAIPMIIDPNISPM